MSLTAPALLAAAAGVGFGHAVLPDHWVPLAVIARAQRYPLRRVARLSGLAGIAHVGFSLILGAIVIGVGLQFRATVERHEALIVGGLLIATGALFVALELLGRGHAHSHHDPEHPHDDDHGHQAHDHATPGHAHQHTTTTLDIRPNPHGHNRNRATRLLAFAVPFGAAASPDLTVLPVFLAASAIGAAAALGTLIAFSLATLTTIVGLTMLGTLAGYQLRGAWIDKSANLITATALLTIGILIATNII
ncbi:hypothetical protein [Nocardia terpenica]|uniref:Nickel/cobalt efflux system n=1 Tax=Nocardia terpenica TaxID=455432 RepID=A0A6G9Z1R1_9NOCA|nr:hypothetical protein [Nocardia terpenica]QIS19525.1 hypothetical protein F6W96_15785 [Nocardia terpenica]